LLEVDEKQEKKAYRELQKKKGACELLEATRERGYKA